MSPDLSVVDHAHATRVEAVLAGDLTVFVAGMVTLEPSSGASSLAVAGGWVHFTGDGLFGNRASGLGLTGAVGPDAVDRVEAFFDTAGVRCQFEVCPLADSGLLHELARRGYAATSFRNIYSKALDAPRPLPPGVRVAQPGDFDAWNQVLLDGFGYARPEARARVEIWNHMLFSRPEVALLLHEIDGRPVGVATMVLSDREASLGGTTTLPSHRRQGVQTALLAARLRLAAGSGCTLAVTTADAGSASARNIERSGFRLSYTNLRLRHRRGQLLT